jgi:hypothetical protein
MELVRWFMPVRNTLLTGNNDIAEMNKELPDCLLGHVSQPSNNMFSSAGYTQAVF